VPGHHPLPVGKGRDGRPPAREQGGRFKGREVVVSADARHPSPPAPPHWLTEPRAVELYMELWQTPVATLWQDHHARAVARLAELERMLEDGKRPSWVFSSITAHENGLWLLPRAAKTAGIVIEGEPSRDGAQHDGHDDEDVSDEAFEAQMVELRARGEL